jgi:hypothetical protein
MFDVTITDVTTPYVINSLSPNTTYELQVQAATTDGTSVWSTSAFFTTLEQTIIPGDANGDGLVTIADVVAIVNNIIGKESGTFVFDAADLNDDGKITIVDAVTLLMSLQN